MATYFAPWLSPASSIEDALYEIRKSVIMDWWNRIRPDLLISATRDLRKIKSGGDVNERAWRLGNTGYVQKVRMVEDVLDGTDILRFTGACHAQTKALEYHVKMSISVVDQVAVGVIESSCTCDAASEFGQNALCKHLLALVYALKAVTDSGVIPEWPHICTSHGQSWGVKPSSKADLRPDRALQVHFLRPDRRAAWKSDVRSVMPAQFRLLSFQERTDLIQKVKTSSVYPSSLLRALRKPGQPERSKSPDPVNPFAVPTLWPEDAPVLPLESLGPDESCWQLFYERAAPEHQALYMRKIYKDLQSAAMIEKRTRTQNTDTEWKVQRSQRLTSTFTKRAVTAIHNVTPGKEQRRRSLAMQILKPINLSNNVHVRRGTELEPVAVSYFIKIMENRGKMVEAFSVGFVIHPSESWLGASPDRLLKITDRVSKAVEWCLLEVKTYDSSKLLSSVGYLKENQLDFSSMRLRDNHAHFYQVQTA